MLQSTLGYIAFQGVFRLPGLGFFLSPIAWVARIYFHNELGQTPGTSSVPTTDLTLSVILTLGAKFCGLQEEFQTAARWIDIASCSVRLSEAMRRLAAHISHLFTYTLYGTSLETAVQKQLDQAPSLDFIGLAQLVRHFFLALAHFHLALSGEGSEYLLFHNIAQLKRQFGCHKDVFTRQMQNLLPGQPKVALATEQLLQKVYDQVYRTWTQTATHMGYSMLTRLGLTQMPQEEPTALSIPIRWTATPALC